MATIGLDKLYYAKITEGDNGNETYSIPVNGLIKDFPTFIDLQNNIKDNGFFSMSENFSVSTNTETSQYSLTAQLTTDITQSQSSKTASDTENNSEN